MLARDWMLQRIRFNMRENLAAPSGLGDLWGDVEVVIWGLLGSQCGMWGAGCEYENLGAGVKTCDIGEF